jgi:hypothetical protein
VGIIKHDDLPIQPISAIKLLNAFTLPTHAEQLQPNNCEYRIRSSASPPQRFDRGSRCGPIEKNSICHFSFKLDGARAARSLGANARGTENGAGMFVEPAKAAQPPTEDPAGEMQAAHRLGACCEFHAARRIRRMS